MHIEGEQYSSKRGHMMKTAGTLNQKVGKNCSSQWGIEALVTFSE